MGLLLNDIQMKKDTNIILGGGNIEGNIGSCEIKVTYVSMDSWHTTSMAVNSCNGQIVAQNTYFDWSPIYFPVIIIFVILCLVVFLKMFD